ncbi:hypothetical protein HanRHA438_Chr16g0766221 [Helianthus annuus]|nr:hypothetical protein HanRHA438_Chr16g0766221 [Helianthus annuus]
MVRVWEELNEQWCGGGGVGIDEVVIDSVEESEGVDEEMGSVEVGVVGCVEINDWAW